jgi:hypothetical protein
VPDLLVVIHGAVRAGPCVVGHLCGHFGSLGRAAGGDDEGDAKDDAGVQRTCRGAKAAGAPRPQGTLTVQLEGSSRALDLAQVAERWAELVALAPAAAAAQVVVTDRAGTDLLARPDRAGSEP